MEVGNAHTAGVNVQRYTASSRITERTAPAAQGAGHAQIHDLHLLDVYIRLHVSRYC